MTEQILLVVHVLVALAIVGLILLQQGKGADMGASFGGGGSQTLFGPSGGGNVLTRATAVLAAVFFITSFSLAILAKQKAGEINVTDEAMMLESVAEEQALIEQSIDEQAVDLGLPQESEFGTDALLNVIDEIPE